MVKPSPFSKNRTSGPKQNTQLKGKWVSSNESMRDSNLQGLFNSVTMQIAFDHKIKT